MRSAGTNLVRPYVADGQVGVAGGGVDAVLLKVLTDVVRGGLRQQPVNALPGEGIGHASTRGVWRRIKRSVALIPLSQDFERFPALCPPLNHPRSVKGCQKASSAARPHGPKGL